MGRIFHSLLFRLHLHHLVQEFGSPAASSLSATESASGRPTVSGQMMMLWMPADKTTRPYNVRGNTCGRRKNAI